MQKPVGQFLHESDSHTPNRADALLTLNDEPAEEQEKQDALDGSQNPLKENIVTLKSTDPEHPHSWSMVKETYFIH
jgi:hypothetical protein